MLVNLRQITERYVWRINVTVLTRFGFNSRPKFLLVIICPSFPQRKNLQLHIKMADGRLFPNSFQFSSHTYLPMQLKWFNKWLNERTVRVLRSSCCNLPFNVRLLSALETLYVLFHNKHFANISFFSVCNRVPSSATKLTFHLVKMC
jgi:hypothetical protein